MAKKKSPGEPSTSRASARASRSRAPRVALIAHPRLMHGYLVHLEPRLPPTLSVGAAVASARKKEVRAAHPRREGPTDDATFH